MAVSGAHKRSACAIFLLALLAGHEVAALRQKSQVLTSKIGQEQKLEALYVQEQAEEEAADDETDAAQGDPWESLRTGAAGDQNVRCSERMEELYSQAFLVIVRSIDKMADKCEEAKASRLSKCMGKVAGVSPTSLMRRAWRFQFITRKIADCPWAKDVAQSYGTSNEAMGLSIDRIYQNAPEFKRFRKDDPAFSFGSFVHKVVDMKPESANDVEHGIFDAMSKGFGKQFPVTAEEASDTMKRAHQEDLANEDIDSVDADAGMDALVDSVQPEWCYRQRRWFSSNSGCTNAGFRGADSCFMFEVEQSGYVSELHTTKGITPDDLIANNQEIVLVKSESRSKRQINGYKKSGWHTWGICLPKADPKGSLDKINALRAELLSNATHVNVQTALLELAGGAKEGDNSSLSSLLQHGELAETTKTQIFGYIFQLPSVILLYTLYMVNFAVFLPVWLVQVAVHIVSYPLLLLGDLGKLLRFTLAIPKCIIASWGEVLFGWLYAIINVIYKLGSFLGGAKKGLNGFDSRETYAGSVCTLFRNGIFGKDTPLHVHMRDYTPSEPSQPLTPNTSQ